ncbi:MAG: hypothetical protein ABIH23_23815 [bacterium]
MNKNTSYRLAAMSVILLLLLLCPAVSQADDWDPTDDQASGAPDLGMPSGDEQIHGPHTLSNSDQMDWFLFLLNQDETYEFFTTGFADTVGELYRSDGVSMVAMNDENGPDPNFQIRYTPTETGQFYLKVKQFASQQEITYDLRYINRSAALDIDEWDPGDDVYGGATDLGAPSLDGNTHGPHTLSSQDPYDWFQFILLEGEVYEFYTSSGVDTAGDLYRSNGITRVASADSGGLDANFQILYSVSESGTYYLRVRMADAEFNGKYTLYYRSGAEPPPAGDEWDPADDIFDGAPRLGTPLSQIQRHGPHSLSDTDRFDWFQFVLQPGETYSFSTIGGSDTVGDLYGSDGTTHLSTDDNGGENNNFEILFTAGEYGKYFLRIHEYSSGDAGYYLTYQLVGQIPPPTLDEWDSLDDDIQGATSLDTGSTQILSHGPHSLSTADYYDYFQLTLEAGIAYQFMTSGDSDTFGSLLASDGMTAIVEKDDGGTRYNFSMQFTPTITGTYYLRVSLYDLGANGWYMLYALRVVEPSPFGDEWDPADDVFSGATELQTPSTFEEIHGPHSLSATDLSDWFRVYLIAGTAYELSSRGESDTVATLYFYNENTQIVQQDGGGVGGNFSIYIIPTESGFYYLRVHEFKGGDAVFTLHLRGEPTPSDLLTPFRAYTFDNPGEYTAFPGGFIGAAGGTDTVGPIPAATGYSDGEGVTLTAQPGEVVLLLFPTLDIGDRWVLARAAVESTGSGAEVTLGVLDSSMDGSIATNGASDSSLLLNTYRHRVLLFDPPGTRIRPVFQLANLNGTQTVSVYFDNLEIYLLPEEGSVPGWLVSSGEISQNNPAAAVKPIKILTFETSNEFTEVPGGFINAPAGTVSVGGTPSAPGHSDGQGVMVTAEQNQVSLLMLPEVQPGSGMILVRASVLSSGQGAAVALAAMDRATKGSISTNIPADSSIFESGYERMVLLFQPDTNAVIPLFQVAHREGSPQTTVFMDSFEVFLLPADALIPAKLLLGY